VKLGSDQHITKFLRDSPWVHSQVVNKRQWKAMKRRELDALIKAAQAFNSGAIATPKPIDTLKLLRMLGEWRKALNVTNWGR
jgi:hypothetical protein